MNECSHAFPPTSVIVPVPRYLSLRLKIGFFLFKYKYCEACQ